MHKFKLLNNKLLSKSYSLIPTWLPHGRWHGRLYFALNPTRPDNNIGSFYVDKEKGSWIDHATNDSGSDLISLYAYLNNLSQGNAYDSLTDYKEYKHLTINRKIGRKNICSEARSQSTSKYALKIWEQSIEPDKTPVDTYLQSRALNHAIPKTLRYHSGLKASNGLTYPTMVAGINHWPDDDIKAIHRTFLSSDGKKKADTNPNKMALGNISGGAVRFGEDLDTIVVAEGIETALSIYQETSLTTWAVLSCSGYKNLILPRPEITKIIIIAADNDSSGLNTAQEAAKKWWGKGYTVKTALPPVNCDFNDLLKGNCYES